MQQREILEYLRRSVRDRTIVPFLGAGIGRAIASLPSWKEAGQSLLDYVRLNRTELVVDLRSIRAIESQIKAGRTLDALSALQALFGERKHWLNEAYGGWLHDTFGAIEPSQVDPLFLQALAMLDPRLVVTTSYDTLVEDYMETGHDRLATWLDASDARNLIRVGSGVLHLHGTYRIPESVILSRSDYQRVADSDAAARVVTSLFDCGTLLFIGCSADGLDDPHIAELLDSFSALSNPRVAADAPHVFLHVGRMPGTIRTRLNRQGIETYSFGDNYIKLPAFLESLSLRESIAQAAYDRLSVTIRSILFAANKASVLARAAEVIRTWIYPDLEIRVGYAELDSVDELHETILVQGDQPCVFHYPLSVAGWALVEGRIIGWPQDSHRLCDQSRLRNLGRLEQAAKSVKHLADAGMKSRLSRYLDLSEVYRKFLADELCIGDIFQDWSNTGGDIQFSSFVSVPVPRIHSVSNDDHPFPMGVFNIDTRSDTSLATKRTLSQLNVVSDLVYTRLVMLHQDAESEPRSE